MGVFVSILLTTFRSLTRSGRREDARSPTCRHRSSTACEDLPPSSPVPLTADNRTNIFRPGPLSPKYQTLLSHSYEHDQGSDVRSLDSQAPFERDLTNLRVVEYLESLETAHVIKSSSLSSQSGSLSSSPSLSNQPLSEETAILPPIPSLQENPTTHSKDEPDLTQESTDLHPEITPISSHSPVELGISWNKSDTFSRSDMLPTQSLTSKMPAPPPIKSAVTNSISPPTILTTELLNIGNDAFTTYMAVCEEHRRLTRRATPFSSLSPKQLEAHFVAAVDAKNALRLRKSVVAVDISDSLEELLPKLTLYEEDERVVEAAFEDINLIKEECTRRNLSPNFYALEFLRQILPSHTLSTMERHRDVFSSMQHVLEESADAQRITAQFISDPFALREHRLRHRTYQR